MAASSDSIHASNSSRVTVTFMVIGIAAKGELSLRVHGQVEFRAPDRLMKLVAELALDQMDERLQCAQESTRAVAAAPACRYSPRCS